MVMNFGNYDINIHMLNHYKRVTSAKNVINTRSKAKKKNNVFKSSSVASGSHSRFSSPTNLSSGKRAESTQSHYQLETEGCSVKQSRIGSAISKKENNRIISSIVFAEDETHEIDDPGCLKCPNNTCTSLCSEKISNFPSVKIPLPTPRSISTNRSQQKSSTVPEFEYLQFSLRITEDIIRNDLYTNKEMQRVFNSHIEANRGRLSMKRMLEQINLLCKELNIGKDTKNQNSFKYSPKQSTIKSKNLEKGDNPSSMEIIDKILSEEKLLTDDEIQKMDDKEIQDVINKLLCANENDNCTNKNESTKFSLDCGDLLRSPEMTVEEFLDDSASEGSNKQNKIIMHNLLLQSPEIKNSKFNFDKYINLNFQKMGIDASVQTALDKLEEHTEDCTYNLDNKEKLVLMDGIFLEQGTSNEDLTTPECDNTCLSSTPVIKNEISNLHKTSIEILKPLTSNYFKSSLDNVSLQFSENISNTINIKPVPMIPSEKNMTSKDKEIKSATNIETKKISSFTNNVQSQQPDVFRLNKPLDKISPNIHNPKQSHQNLYNPSQNCEKFQKKCHDEEKYLTEKISVLSDESFLDNNLALSQEISPATFVVSSWCSLDTYRENVEPSNTISDKSCQNCSSSNQDFDENLTLSQEMTENTFVKCPRYKIYSSRQNLDPSNSISVQERQNCDTCPQDIDELRKKIGVENNFQSTTENLTLSQEKAANTFVISPSCNFDHPKTSLCETLEEYMTQKGEPKIVLKNKVSELNIDGDILDDVDFDALSFENEHTVTPTSINLTQRSSPVLSENNSPKNFDENVTEILKQPEFRYPSFLHFNSIPSSDNVRHKFVNSLSPIPEEEVFSCNESDGPKNKTNNINSSSLSKRSNKSTLVKKQDTSQNVIRSLEKVDSLEKSDFSNTLIEISSISTDDKVTKDPSSEILSHNMSSECGTTQILSPISTDLSDKNKNDIITKSFCDFFDMKHSKCGINEHTKTPSEILCQETPTNIKPTYSKNQIESIDEKNLFDTQYSKSQNMTYSSETILRPKNIISDNTLSPKSLDKKFSSSSKTILCHKSSKDTNPNISLSSNCKPNKSNGAKIVINETGSEEKLCLRGPKNTISHNSLSFNLDKKFFEIVEKGSVSYLSGSDSILCSRSDKSLNKTDNKESKTSLSSSKSDLPMKSSKTNIESVVSPKTPQYESSKYSDFEENISSSSSSSSVKVESLKLDSSSIETLDSSKKFIPNEQKSENEKLDIKKSFSEPTNFNLSTLFGKDSIESFFRFDSKFLFIKNHMSKKVLRI